MRIVSGGMFLVENLAACIKSVKPLLALSFINIVITTVVAHLLPLFVGSRIIEVVIPLLLTKLLKLRLELSKVLLQHLVDFPHLQVLVFVVLACLIRLLQLFFESKF